MINTKILEKYDIPVPRYTSYPTVPYWTDSPTTTQWLDSLKQTLSPESNWSMYIHIPFCENLCTFCGCNSTITRNHDVEKSYIDSLLAEWEIYKENVPALKSIPMKQLHFGGGTPTFLSVESLTRLMEGITAGLVNTDGKSERSLEVDPRHTSYEQLECLRKFHFNRISLGVQDFSEHVQSLINRYQSYEQTRDVTNWARELGYTSINFDLIYGLPDQTEEIMEYTLEKTIELRPDRIALYSFALVPWIKPTHRKFTDEQVPKGAAKRSLYELSRKRLLDAGYLEIGMDHFALPDDELSQGEKQNSLHRNFMGYTPYKTDALIGLGVSAISESKDCYHQNEKIISLYEEKVSTGSIPTSRGHLLNEEDINQRELILELMTSWNVDLDKKQHEDIFSLLSPMVDDQLIDLSEEKLQVKKDGRPFIRNICVAFDKRMQKNKPIKRIFSQSL
jgi:oxygen-independent coproporphyrinogen-3 oxidase